jgi:hypothetical protein
MMFTSGCCFEHDWQLHALNHIVLSPPCYENFVTGDVVATATTQGVHGMHSLFYATAHLTRVRVHPVDLLHKPRAAKTSPLEFQATLCGAILLFALGISFSLWLLGAWT